MPGSSFRKIGTERGIDALGSIAADGLRFLASAIDQAGPTVQPTAIPLLRFLRTRVHIRTKDVPPRIIPLRVWPTQRRALAMKRRMLAAGAKHRFLTLKYRQCGLTTLEMSATYRLVACFPNSLAVMLTDVEPKTEIAFRMAHLMDDYDPEAPPKKKISSSRIEYKHNSMVFIGTAGSKGLGRALTLQRVHGSEVALWGGTGEKKVQKQESLISGLDTSVEHGEFDLETTPDGQEYFYRLWEDSKAGKNNWNRIFLPWFVDRRNVIPVTDEDIEEIRDTLIPRERDLMSPKGPLGRKCLSFAQIQWRRATIKRVGRTFQMDFPEDDISCFMASGQCRFGTSRVMARLEQLGTVHADAWEEWRGGRRIQWGKPMDGKRYVLGCDTSEGAAGSDPNGYLVLCRDTGEMVEAAHGCWSPRDLAMALWDVTSRYKGCLTGIERNNHGHAVIAHFTMMGGADRLYYGNDGKAGWNTDAISRDIMLDDLEAIFGDRPDLFVYRELLGEMLTFRKQDSGKWAADSGCHDDRVMLTAIAFQMMKIPDRSSRRITFIPHT